MAKRIILYNLADNVTDEEFKEYVTTDKGPLISSLPAVKKYELVKITGSMTGEIPYKYCGIVDLTSIDELTLESDLHIHHPIEDYIKMLAIQAESSGLDGVVASAREIDIIRSVCDRDFLIVTPGIRPAWASTDDQKRIQIPAVALKAGASHLVIGRPVSKADDPAEAAARIVAEIEESLSRSA